MLCWLTAVRARAINILQYYFSDSSVKTFPLKGSYPEEEGTVVTAVIIIFFKQHFFKYECQGK